MYYPPIRYFSSSIDSQALAYRFINTHEWTMHELLNLPKNKCQTD